jgi:thiol-disulfide isomerase/thioredoxin
MIVLGVVAVLYVIVSAAGNGSGGSLDGGGSEFLSKFEKTVPPKPAPSMPFVNPDGQLVTLKDQVGRVTLVNLWATWCGPCRLEMPSLDRLQAQLGGDNFEVMVISVDRAGLKKSAEFMDKLGIQNLKTYNDKTSAVAKALGAEGLPTTILLDENANEIGRLAGPAEWDSPEVVNFLRDFLPAG